MNNPKISIITVVYNCVDNIKKSIDNTLCQTYSNMELIIVDGDSKDGTLDVIKQYESRIKFISEKDKGIYDAMNKGINMASGEWVLMHNCGDYFLTNSCIEDVFKHVREDEDFTFIACNMLVYNGYGVKELIPNMVLDSDIYKGMPLHHPATFIRKGWHINHLYDLAYRNSADYNFFATSLLNKRTFLHVKIPLVLFDASEGTTFMHYDITLSDNIAIIEKLGASKEQIDVLKNKLKLLHRNTSIKKRFPFINTVLKFKRKITYKILGWEIIEKETLYNTIP